MIAGCPFGTLGRCEYSNNRCALTSKSWPTTHPATVLPKLRPRLCRTRNYAPRAITALSPLAWLRGSAAVGAYVTDDGVVIANLVAGASVARGGLLGAGGLHTEPMSGSELRNAQA